MEFHQAPPPPYVNVNESMSSSVAAAQGCVAPSSTTIVINDDRYRQMYQPVPLVQSFTGHILLSCCAFWCCGFFFGAISFILAICAQNHSTSMSVKDRQTARRLGTASMCCSAFSIVVGVILWVVVGLGVAGAFAVGVMCQYSVDGHCYLHRELLTSPLCPPNAFISVPFCYYNPI